MIYDEESDRHVHIPFEQALRATCYGNDKGPKGDLFHLADLDDTVNTKCEFNGGKSVGGDDGWKALGEAAKDNKTNSAQAVVTAIKNAVEAGQWVPVEIVIARPFIEHLMLSAVVTVAGRDTGATLFGPADMQISANTSVKTIEGHYTCHTKSVITKPQNVCVMRDIMCSGYVAGGNTRFFGAGKGSFPGPADPMDIKNAMDARLSFSDDNNAEYGSMLAFCAHYGDGAKRDQVISISQRLLPWEVNRPADNRKEYFPGGSKNFTAVNEALGLDTIHFGEDVRAAENMEFISQGSMNNSLCFVGPHRKYNPFSNQYHELVPGQGHFGPGKSAESFNSFLSDSARLYVFSHPLLCLLCLQMPFRETLAGVVARRCRSRPPATTWCRSRRRPRPRCSCRSASRQTPR